MPATLERRKLSKKRAKPKITSLVSAKGFLRANFAKTSNPEARKRILNEMITGSEGEAKRFLENHKKRLYS